MAIIRRFLCFDNVRYGSIASGIYTLIYSIIILGFIAREIAFLVEYRLIDYISISPLAHGFYVIDCMSLAFLTLNVIASILLLVGVSQDQRGLLLPYMVVTPVVTLIHLVHSILFMVAIHYLNEYPAYNLSADSTKTRAVFWLAGMGTVTLLNIGCFLCVVSQYQELQAGRGRLQDVITARITTHTTLINSAAPISNTVVVTHGGAPAAQNYGYPPQQGYPNSPPEYPPQTAGYPPQPAGNPPQQGYPPQQPDAQKI